MSRLRDAGAHDRCRRHQVPRAVAGVRLCGIAPATALPESARLREWLDRGYAGEMKYLHKSAEARADIRHLLPSRAVGHRHRHGVLHAGRTPNTDEQPAIARYAWGEDYHVVLAERLERAASRGCASSTASRSRRRSSSTSITSRSASSPTTPGSAGLARTPVSSIRTAARGCFSPASPSASTLPADAPMADQCGGCTLCIDACPTGALVDEHELDATRCISYLTIELEGRHSGSSSGRDRRSRLRLRHLSGRVPMEPRAARDARSRVAAAAVERDRRCRPDLWQRIATSSCISSCDGSAMTRTPLSRLRRNLAVVLGNSGDESALAGARPPGPRCQARRAERRDAARPGTRRSGHASGCRSAVATPVGAGVQRRGRLVREHC